MSYVETAWSHASIPAELAAVRPMGDFVLVRMLPEEEMHRNLIWLPQFSGTYADRQMRPVYPSIGEVVGCGPGDIKTWATCSCGKKFTTTESNLSEGPCCWYCCPRCGSSVKSSWRHPMHVSPGDRIMYWRVPANEVMLNDETFQFLHEQQHILGVIEN
jgi:co-chaperonin GroES (HSP10)